MICISGDMDMKHAKVCALLILSTMLLSSFIERSNAAGQLYVTVHTDREAYDIGELVSIQGQVLDGSSAAVPLATVSIQANDPDGKPIHVAQVISSPEGTYSDQFTASPNAINGGYTIYVTASKPGYEDAYNQAGCIITPELPSSHMPWLMLLLTAFALFFTKRGRKSSKITEHHGRLSTDNSPARMAHASGKMKCLSKSGLRMEGQ